MAETALRVVRGGFGETALPDNFQSAHESNILRHHTPRRHAVDLLQSAVSPWYAPRRAIWPARKRSMSARDNARPCSRKGAWQAAQPPPRTRATPGFSCKLNIQCSKCKKVRGWRKRQKGGKVCAVRVARATRPCPALPAPLVSPAPCPRVTLIERHPTFSFHRPASESLGDSRAVLGCVSFAKPESVTDKPAMNRHFPRKLTLHKTTVRRRKIFMWAKSCHE